MWTDGIHRGRQGERNNSSSTDTRLNHALMRYIRIIIAVEGLKKTLGGEERGEGRGQGEREREIVTSHKYNNSKLSKSIKFTYSSVNHIVVRNWQMFAVDRQKLQGSTISVNN